MNGRYERAGGAIGFGIGAGIGAFAHVYVIANLVSLIKHARETGEMSTPPPAEKVSVFSEEGLQQLGIAGYITWMLVGSIVAMGIAGYFAGKKIGEKVDSVYPL